MLTTETIENIQKVVIYKFIKFQKFYATFATHGKRRELIASNSLWNLEVFEIL